MAEHIVVHNPATGVADDGKDTPGKLAQFGWGGKQYEIQPGETQLLEPHLAEHARKHNRHLVILDESMGALSFAESQVKLAEANLDRLEKELAGKTAEFKRAQAKVLEKREKFKAEQKIREAELKALADERK
jgi:hypothetical protein